MGEHLETGHWRIKNVNKSPTCENFGFKPNLGQTLVICNNHHAHLNILKVGPGKRIGPKSSHEQQRSYVQLEHREYRWTFWKHRDRADLKAGFLEIQLTYSASIPNENKWKGEGRKKQKTMNSHFSYQLISWSGKWEEQAGSWKLYTLPCTVVLTASMIMEMVELRCSKVGVRSEASL